MTATSRTETGMRVGRAPITHAIIASIARLFSDDQTHRREPSHSTIRFHIEGVGLAAVDPGNRSTPIGKVKRVRGVLTAALGRDVKAGRALIESLVAEVKGCGGFREDSPNFVGADALADAQSSFRSEGHLLTDDGDLLPLLLDGLSGTEASRAIQIHVRRARRGAMDAPLVTGTGKDLLEAIAAHVVVERYGEYSTSANFPTLLGQAFVIKGLAHTHAQSESVSARFERTLYELGCVVNSLRNKEGTGHGRPWLPNVTDHEARAAVEAMGLVGGYLMAK